MPTFETMWGGVTRRTDEREHYHDRWERAVAARLELDVYVPALDSIHRKVIIGGSGIVGSPVPPDVSGIRDSDGYLGRSMTPERICIDFEGNRFGSSNMQTFEDKVIHAAGRHVSVYPTIARLWVDGKDLIRVGSFDCTTNLLQIEDQAAVDEWCS